MVDYLTLKEKAKKIKLLITDNDGVLTDTGVYYSENGEELKRYSIRDGMGVERLKQYSIETGIISGEKSISLQKRAEKLNILELHLGVKNKENKLIEILTDRKLNANEVAYIGDDYNDLEIIAAVGFSASPADAMEIVKNSVDYVSIRKGGNGAFRDFAELIISLREENNGKN